MAFGHQQRPWVMAALVFAQFLATRAAPPPETCAGKPPSVNKTRLGARYTFARVPSPNLVPVPSVVVKVFPAYLTLLNGSTTITVAAAPGNGGGLRRAHELALLLADELKVATSGVRMQWQRCPLRAARWPAFRATRKSAPCAGTRTHARTC